MSDDATIKQVTFDGSFSVQVEMSDGRVYPFRTHPLAARLFASAPAMHRALKEAKDALDCWASHDHDCPGRGEEVEYCTCGLWAAQCAVIEALKAVG